MKLTSSSVALESQHASVEQHSVSETLRFWKGSQRPDFEGEARANNRIQPAVLVTISDAAKVAQSSEAEAVRDSLEDAENDPKIQLILRMVELMTGFKVHLVKPEDLQLDQKTRQQIDQAQPAGQSAPQQRAGWGLEYDYRETHYEAEQTSFSAQGTVKTSDGREISFDLRLAMSREYYAETNLSVRAGDAVRKDPLVINFNGTSAQLTDIKFAFDIDADGKQDNISFVAPGSGFLALDRNNDGKINDGNELFGAKSGDGFGDLAQYDMDGNQWIDENDEIYADLRIWTRDPSGDDRLTTLTVHKVGALYLGNVASPFSIKDANNTELGQVRASSLYLDEDGTPGTLQQIDLSV